MNSKLYTLIIATVALLMVSCSGYTPDRGLETIAGYIEERPEEAILALDSIDPSGFSDADRHYYDLLTIKAKDKAYVVHTSDSLILDVINYYQSHPSRLLYPEALYYGGRVYSDMGDFPSALRYFQQVLDLLPFDDEHLHLRGNVVSQTGGLLDKLGLYEQAIPYLDEALSIDSIEGDPFNLTYTHSQRGLIALRLNDLQQAKSHFIKAKQWASTLPACEAADIDVYLASVAFRESKLDSAKQLIDNSLPGVHPSFRNLGLLNAIEIYLAIGSSDTAYIYAEELAHSRDENNKKSGYRYLLSDDLIKFIPEDSVISYVKTYRTLVNRFQDRRDSEAVLIQNSYYNYQQQQQKKEELERRQQQYKMGGIALCLICAILVIIVLSLKYRNKLTILKLREALDDLSVLKSQVQNDEVKQKTEPAVIKGPAPIKENIAKSEIEILRQRYKEELLAIGCDGNSQPIPQKILNSSEYEQLQEFIAEGKCIPDHHPLWKRIAQLFNANGNNLNQKLRLLTGRELSHHEMQSIYLIKCGVTPTQLSILLAKSKSTISYRRSALCKKILGSGYNTSAMDNVIRRI